MSQYEAYRRKFTAYSDDELQDAIDQLQGEVAIPGAPDYVSDELDAAQDEADDRGVSY